MEIYETKSADLGAKLSLAKVMSLCRGGEQIVAQEKENSKCTSNEIEIRAKKGNVLSQIIEMMPSLHKDDLMLVTILVALISEPRIVVPFP